MVVLALKLTRMDSLKRLHMKDNHQLFYSGCHLPDTVVIFYLGLMVDFNSFFQLFCFFCSFVYFVLTAWWASCQRREKWNCLKHPEWSYFFLSLLIDYKDEQILTTNIATKEKTWEIYSFKEDTKPMVDWQLAFGLDTWKKPSEVTEIQKLYDKTKKKCYCRLSMTPRIYLCSGFFCNPALLNYAILILENALTLD